MTKKKTYTETVNEARTVTFYKHIHEVTTEDGMNLIMTQKIPKGKKVKAPLMMVHGLGQNRFSWTLSRRSMENYFVDEGFTTFNVELRGHGLSRANGSDYPTSFETYLKYDIPALISAVKEISGNSKIFYMGHSLGGAISYCVGSRFQKDLAGIISVAGPYNMAEGNPFLKVLTKVGAMAFKILPVYKIHPEAFYIDYLGVAAKYGLFALDSPMNLFPVQVWYPRSMERDILLERIEKGFDRTSFSVMQLLIEWGASGRLHGTGGHKNYEDRIRDLTIPILFVNGDRDYGVPPSSVKPAWEKAGSKDKTFHVFGGEAPGLHWGHCDLIFGRHAPRIVWPVMLNWMNERVVA